MALLNGDAGPRLYLQPLDRALNALVTVLQTFGCGRSRSSPRVVCLTDQACAYLDKWTLVASSATG